MARVYVGWVVRVTKRNTSYRAGCVSCRNMSPKRASQRPYGPYLVTRVDHVWQAVVAVLSARARPPVRPDVRVRLHTVGGGRHYAHGSDLQIVRQGVVLGSIYWPGVRYLAISDVTGHVASRLRESSAAAVV